MKVAIVKLSAMGDIIHAMATLQYIKAYDETIRVDWIVERGFAGVLEHHPDIENILTLDLKGVKKGECSLGSQIATVRNYAENGYDLVIDAQGLLKSAVVAKMLGHSVGFNSRSIRESAAAWLYSQSFAVPYGMNVIERNVRLIQQALGMPQTMLSFEERRPYLFYAEDDRAEIMPLLDGERKNIVHILGSSWESKIYPAEHFAEIISTLAGNHLLVWGSEEEKVRAEFISKYTDARVVPKLTLNGLKALVDAADLVIGGDSGPTHMAWALKRPSITIFGPTPRRRNLQETPINLAIDCGKTIDPRKLNRQDHCIRNIAPERITALARELIR